MNESFTTDIMEPNDVDCVLLAAEDAKDLPAEQEIRQGFPFLEISLVGLEDFNELVQLTFATDRFDVSKGMIELLL